MKSSGLLCYLFAASLAIGASSQLLLPQFKKPSSHQTRVNSLDQSPIMDAPNIVLPPSGNEGTPSSNPTGDVVISDVISSAYGINIFAGFTRDIDPVAERLDDSSKNTTVLAPMNSELMKMPRKPWEDPKDYDELGADAYEGKSGEDRAHRNLRRFVEAHIVPSSPWTEGAKIKTLAGRELWWEMAGEKKMIKPGNIEVERIANTVTNGEVWVLRGVVEYA